MNSSNRRGGFALMATLWIVVAIAAATFSMAESAHFLMDGARNRTNTRIATWRALGCFARIRAKLAEDLKTGHRASEIWDSLDVYAAAQNDGCRDTATASGTVLDVNHVSARAIRATLDAADIDPILIDHVMSLTVAGGHRPYGSREEMQAAAGGLMQRVGADTLFGVDTGRINAVRTSLAVRLGAMTDMLADTTDERATSARTSLNPSNIASIANGPTTLIAQSPEAWWLRIEASRGDPAVTVRLEAHVVLIGGTVGVEDIRL